MKDLVHRFRISRLSGFALLSAAVILLLGTVTARYLAHQITERELHRATATADSHEWTVRTVGSASPAARRTRSTFCCGTAASSARTSLGSTCSTHRAQCATQPIPALSMLAPPPRPCPAAHFARCWAATKTPQ